jgi:hypothetical protein
MAKEVFASRMQRFASSLHEISASCQFVNSNHVIRINSERGKGPPAEDAASGKTTRRGPTRPDSAFGHQNFPKT